MFFFVFFLFLFFCFLCFFCCCKKVCSDLGKYHPGGLPTRPADGDAKQPDRSEADATR